MFPSEDVYGTRKCVAFVSEAVTEARPARVLDIGCGTGEKLTFPLAAAHPQVAFLAVDADARSIEYARGASQAPNLQFRLLDELQEEERFDLIVASEVVEHVESPAAFLRDLRSRLAPGGRIVLTVPNGYGPSEFASLLETLLALSGLLDAARAAKRALWKKSGGAPAAPPAERDTLAVSPHINFFSWREMQRVIRAAGLCASRYRPRTLFCGFGFDLAIRSEPSVRWNSGVADRLPAPCVSGWMFVLEAAGSPTAYAGEHARGAFSCMRRWLNEKRWGLR